ncbi:GerMN domain-containing protein [Haloactinopolyspora sp.]|uniref:GerMN domain-containing protein n=1 Tax=Haloactinopolyspora sp. TaxID=1966353 RepID=UPI00260F486F|nr:GerMN domain-containing protein [Haloactinopolyspora sp.]
MTRLCSWVLAAAVLTVSACGIRPTGSIDAGPGARASWESAVVYFLHDGRPYPAVRPDLDSAGPQELVEALAAGPTTHEQDVGLRTEVPPSVRLVVDGDRLVVDSPGRLSRAALQQIACTLQRSVTVGVDHADCPVP